MNEFNAHDMATAAADGFRDGVASARAVPAEQGAMVVPEGYALVPVEPTHEMLAEIHLLDSFTLTAIKARYRAMLAAAPTPEQPAKEQGHE